TISRLFRPAQTDSLEALRFFVGPRPFASECFTWSCTTSSPARVPEFVHAGCTEGAPRGSWHVHVPQRKWALVHLELAPFPAEARRASEALVAIKRVLLSDQPATRCLRKNSSVRWRARLAACGA